MKEKMSRKKFSKTYAVVEEYQNLSNDKSDVLGSWSGRSYDGDRPTQDADDL